MYDLNGKEIEIISPEKIETNLNDDLEDTIDISKVVEEIKNNE